MRSATPVGNAVSSQTSRQEARGPPEAASLPQFFFAPLSRGGQSHLARRLFPPSPLAIRAFTPVGACHWARRRRDPMDGLWWRARCPYLPDGGYGLPARRLPAPRNDVHMIEYPNNALPVII